MSPRLWLPGSPFAERALNVAEHRGHITVIEHPGGREAAWEVGSIDAARRGYDIVVELHPRHSAVQPPRRLRAG